jgi:hypothetical protein
MKYDLLRGLADVPVASGDKFLATKFVTSITK